MKPLGKIKLEWSSYLAYAIGLITSDGNLSKDRRHINFTSKDEELVDLFKKCLGIHNKTGKKGRGGNSEKKYFYVAFGDVNFYQFLINIGLTPNKSKTLRELKIPNKYFFEFLRGHFDGDGTFYSYFDKRWKSSYMFYIEFLSASPEHIKWIRKQLNFHLKVKGHTTSGSKSSVIQLKYAKKEAVKIITRLYTSDSTGCCLERKRLKIAQALSIISIE